ncbi:MAG TPA: nitrate reductase molybdenum cofactor assembly chaperone [Rhodocyclaceae bacterium]|nr:nitrate reductase molybdenum cofactor assembly chaperone [Rhodocyclaceae bacterium]
MSVFNLLSMLLDYPDESVRTVLNENTGLLPAEEIVRAADADGLLSDADVAAVAAIIERIRQTDLTELQAEYVKTFDLAPEHSLHITHHIYGEERTRGPALIDLSEYYKSYGLVNLEGELPDYLPLMLEFASQLELDEARVFLGDIAKVLDILAANLERAQSPYAPIIRLIEAQAHLTQLASLAT